MQTVKSTKDFEILARNTGTARVSSRSSKAAVILDRGAILGPATAVFRAVITFPRFPQPLLRAALVAVVLASCTWLKSADAETFSVGVSAPLTGDFSVYGKAVRNGFLMNDDEPPKGAVKFSFEDNRYEAREALSAYRKLVDQQKVDLLFSWGEPPLQSTAPIIEKAGIPTIAMSLDPEPACNKKWIVLSVDHPKNYMLATLSELRRQGKKRFGFLVAEDPFFQALYQEFYSSLLPDEKSEIVGTLSPSDVDLKTLAFKASIGSYDAIGVFVAPGQVRSFYREAAKINFSPNSFGTDVFESKEEIAAAGPKMQGAVFPNLRVPLEFRQQYINKFGNDDQISYAYNAYIIGSWIHKTFGAPDVAALSPDRESILNQLKKGMGEMPLKISERGSAHIAFPIVLRRVVAGGFEDVL